MYLRMILSWCTALRCIPTRPFTIRRRDTTLRDWRFLLGVGMMMGRPGRRLGLGLRLGGNNNININNNNNSNRNSNIGSGNRNNIGAETGHRSNQAAGRSRGDSAGSTIRNIAAAPRMETEVPQTSLAVRLEETRFPIARLAPATGGRQGGNLPSNRAGGAGVSNRASGAGVSNRAGGAGVSNRAGGGGADRVGSRDVSRGGGGNRDAFGGVPGAPRVTTGRVLAPAAAAVPRAWDLEEAVVGGGGGRRR